jgi:hypothetical protein
MKTLFALLVTIGSLVYASDAQAMNAEELLSSCERFVASVQVSGGTVHVVGEDAAACFGYMDAVLDVLVRNRMETCLPDPMVSSQLARVFVRYYQSHPQNLQLALDAVLVAIREAFPCR